jgi:hypothetical protein
MPKPPTVFWGNNRVEHQAIINYGREQTLARMSGLNRVLLVQDTTSLHFNKHHATEGLGILEKIGTRGFLAHSTLAVSDMGEPLGLLEQKAWARGEERIAKTRFRRDFETKESYKWVETLPERQDLAEGMQAIVIGDAEAHIYDFFSVLQTREFDFLIRATDTRSITEFGVRLYTELSQQPVQQAYEIEVKSRPDRDSRQAKVVLRFTPITLKRPERSKADHKTLPVYVVEVLEINPPANETGIHWVLITTLPVETVDDALQIVKWYRFRWLIERFHFVLKSGCQIEDSQLREEKRLERLLAIYSLVAWNLLWLTYHSRQNPDIPCSQVLEEVEWQALYLFTQQTSKLPSTPPTLRQTVHWIAQLGGFLGRKSDGEPGVKVLWRGWARLQDIVASYKLFSKKKDVGND